MGTVRSLSARRVGGKAKVRQQRIYGSLRNFLEGSRVYEIDAKKMTFGSIASFAIYSRTTKPRFSVASLIFLMTHVFCTKPVPCNPSDIAALSDEDGGVGEEQMPVFHCAHIK